MQNVVFYSFYYNFFFVFFAVLCATKCHSFRTMFGGDICCIYIPIFVFLLYCVVKRTCWSVLCNDCGLLHSQSTSCCERILNKLLKQATMHMEENKPKNAWKVNVGPNHTQSA